METKLLEGLKADAKHVEIVAKVNELVAAFNQRQTERDGPKSTRQMTEADANRILLGDLKGESHTKCAETLGLSYGQIYSARKGFTFKTIYKQAEATAKVEATK